MRFLYWAMLLWAPAVLAAPITENVLVVVIDGLRNDEAFADSTHQYIPNIWGDLRPRGVIYTEFYNDSGTTYTTPGHVAMLTGRWHLLPNSAPNYCTFDVRPDVPTVFEHYRQQHGADPGSCWIISGKAHNLNSDWSFRPDYGSEFGAEAEGGVVDQAIFDRLAEVMSTEQPNLVLVNLADVDSAGHTKDWDCYTQAISHADQLSYQIWHELIQGDPHYRDLTTMILTSDHGRHSDGFGGFANHGGMCAGDRHVPFLALGPDTPAGIEIEERRYLTDIAPTIGELLQFDTPFSQGQTMTGIFSEAPNPRRQLSERDPQLALLNDKVFLTYAANDAEDTGTSRIYLASRDLNEPGFGSPQRLDTSARWAHEPALAAVKSSLHLAWLDGRALDGRGDAWNVLHRVSNDGGTSWASEQAVTLSRFETDEDDEAEIVTAPLLLNMPTIPVAVVGRFSRGQRELKLHWSRDGGGSWMSMLLDDELEFPRSFSGTLLGDPGSVMIAWSDLAPTEGDEAVRDSDWEIFYITTLNHGQSWTGPIRHTSTPAAAYDPVVAYGDGILLLAWASAPVGTTDWRILLSHSLDRGQNFSAPIRMPQGEGWQPALVWIDHRFRLVWSSHDKLFYANSIDGVAWSSPREVAAGGRQCRPDLLAAPGRVIAAWEELDEESGDWQVRSAELRHGAQWTVAPAVPD